jgi:hypothetical protein
MLATDIAARLVGRARSGALDLMGNRAAVRTMAAQTLPSHRP